MSYAQEFFNNYIEPNKINSFTHRDLLQHTNTNCSYSVLRCLKAFLHSKGLQIREEKEERINEKNEIKRYKRFYIEVING